MLIGRYRISGNSISALTATIAIISQNNAVIIDEFIAIAVNWLIPYHSKNNEFVLLVLFEFYFL